MDILILVLLFCGGLIAGGLSAVAGGATFLTFPILLASGLSPLVANVTNFVALTPANVTALAAYREELRELKNELPGHLLIGGCGGVIGALLLLWSGEAQFEKLVPWLMLVATVLFAFGGWLRVKLETLADLSKPKWRWVFRVVEFVLCVYGGYFGAGLGIILLACLMIIARLGLHQANAIKNAVISLLSIVAFFIYMSSGLLAWKQGIILFTGTVIGGYVAVRFIKNIPEQMVRNGVLVWAIGLTIFSFWKYA